MKKLQNLLSSKKKNDRPSSGYKKTALETSRPILSPMPSSSQQRQMGAKTEYPHIQTSIQPPHTSAKIEPRNQPVHSPTPSSSQPVQPKIEVSDQQLSNLLANATIVSMTTPNFADLVPEEPAATKSLPPPLPAHDDTEEQITKEQAVENRIYQIEKNIEHINNGALQVSAWKVMEEVSVSVYLQGLDKDSFFTREVSDGTTQTHEAFKLLKAIDIVEEKKEKYRDDHRFRTLDSEILDKYEGVVPGTVTAEAYGNEMSLLAKTDDRFTFTFSTASAPEGLTVKKLVARLNELQKGGLGHVWAADRQKVLYEDLMKYITSSSTWFDPNEKYKWSTQARELIDRLNNGNIFMDLSENSSFLVFFQEMGLPDCFYQILLGTELRLRLPLIGDWYFTGSRTRTVKTSLIISKRWQDHVRVTYDDEKESIQWRSNVHEQQIDGLLRFADTMGWPYMESLRPVAETVYPNMISGGQEVNSQIWDWLYGVVLPGKYASFKIMTTLVMLTPETKDLKWAPFYNSGLVVEGCSFWRLKSILGRVLGGSPGATGLMHWVGPCPPVIEGLDDGVKMSWVLIKARSVDDPGLINLERSFTDVNVFEYFADDFKKNPDMVIDEMQNEDHWVPLDPLPPLNQADEVKFSGLKLRKNPLDVSIKEPTDASYNYTAIIQMDILGKIETFTLYTDIYFVASHPCIGTHSVHKRQLPGIKRTVVSVKDLKKTRTWKDVLYINVQGQEDAEIAARAWCSERGYHALVKHEDTCDVCLRREAGSLNLKIIIYR